MTIVNIEGRRLGHITTMCGASKVWFPSELAYSRELKVKEKAGQLMFENFTSMTYKLLNADLKLPHYEFVLAINSLFYFIQNWI